MKFVLSLLLIAAAAVAGYVFEPQLRQALTGQVPAEVSSRSIPEATPTVITYTPEQLPKEILIRAGATITLEGSGLKMKAETGATVPLLRIEGNQVIFDTGSGTGSVAMSETDLAEQLSRLTKNPPPQPAPSAPPSPPVAIPSPIPSGEVEKPVETTMEGDSLTPDAPAPVPPVPPTPPEETVITPTVVAMQRSLENGDVTEFNRSQIVEWTTGPDEIKDGQPYQTGMVTCEVTTIFGSKHIQAKAYIQNEKVVNWVWPKSGAKIK